MSKCIGDKSKTRKNVCLLLNKMRDLITKAMEKAEVLKVAFALVIANKLSFRNPRSQRSEGKDGASRMYPRWKRT